MDTYKVATVANSCSTMHKLATTPITKELFSFDEELDSLCLDVYAEFGTVTNVDYFEYQINNIILTCERLRQSYLKTKDIRYWRALIQLLPESWNQMRTWTANYATLRNIYFSREHHKLSEWITFCEEIKKLPYAKELILYKGE